MTGYSVNLHICIMGGQDDRLSFKEKRRQTGFDFTNLPIFIYTLTFSYILFDGSFSSPSTGSPEIIPNSISMFASFYILSDEVSPLARALLYFSTAFLFASAWLPYESVNDS